MVTIKIKDFKLKSFIKLAKLIAYISVDKSEKMIDWMFDNIDKFYAVKM